MAKKFYAVKEGIKTGIFTSWDETSKYVTSVTGAVYKGFNNLSDAKAYLADNESESMLIYRSIKNIRINHIRKFVSDLVKKQPQYIAIEDLNVKGMMMNKHLAKDISNCSFYTIKEHLIRKAKERLIAVRLVDRFYPSSKTCSNCGHYKQDLKLSQRGYHCEHCHETLDRDFNASLNIAKTDNYVLA